MQARLAISEEESDDSDEESDLSDTEEESDNCVSDEENNDSLNLNEFTSNNANMFRPDIHLA